MGVTRQMAMEDESIPRADPTGMAFLELVATAERSHESAIAAALPTMGERLPKCVETLADVLRRLDDEATCRFECRGGSHIRESLIASVVSTAYATIRLVRGGYLDQAFALIRSAGEIANLVTLFVVQRPTFAEWMAIGEQERRRSFSPVKVRLALEAAGIPLPIDEHTYRALSGLGVHHEPGSMPQRYNPIERGMTVPAFQPTGVMAALNELAGVITVVALTMPRFVAMPADRKAALRTDVDRLLANIGKIDALELPIVLRSQRPVPN
jgi:hypothetical protein